MVVYCARPEDWIPRVSVVPLAKITAILALLALVLYVRHIQRLPREVLYLIFLIGQLFLASMMSPVWRGGAVQKTLDFAKVLLLVIVITMAVNTARRLRRLIFVQAASVAVIAVVAVWKGRLILGRLKGTLGGNYSDPNDLALAIIISLPLCFALLLLSTSRIRKTTWALLMLVMFWAVFLTASRGGLITLIATAAIFLWEFAIRGRRRYLMVLAVLAGLIFWQFSAGTLAERFKGALNGTESSAEGRQELFWRSVEVTKRHPLFGVGPGNFVELSGNWHVTHNSFTEMSSEGGMPAFALYVLILWSGFKNLTASKRIARGRTELSLLARALHASLVGYLVGSLFLSVSYQFFPYFLVAYTTVLFQIAKRSASHSREGRSVSQEAPETWAPLQGAIDSAGWAP
jgi:O-antigen ligase